ncbi:MAG: ABC transporter permease, partial [Methylococcaceae bacterium]|nr:ABC transporter permease [Methylococcaceae bacterium]
MIDHSVGISSPPVIKIQGENGECVALRGFWNLRGLAMTPDLRNKTRAYAAGNIAWDLSGI